MENIHIADPEKLKEKISRFEKDNFHLIADFDSTLTKAFTNGEKLVSFYALLRKYNPLSPEYLEKAMALFDYYRPIEFDSNISLEEKNQKMAEWWSKHYDLMIEYGLTKEIVTNLVKKEKIDLREGSGIFFNLLNENNIPLLILSASLGNFVEEFLKYKNKLTKNIHLISNFIAFDQEGRAVSYIRPLIHSFNKKEVQIKNYPYQKEIEKRKNVILLGDSLGDTSMCQGISHSSIIKIGFLNEDAKTLLEAYSKFYDVVILNDGPMDYINSLLGQIINKKINK